MLLYCDGGDVKGFNPLVPTILPIGGRTYFFSIRRLASLTMAFVGFGATGIAALPMFIGGGNHGRSLFLLVLVCMALAIKLQPWRQFIIEGTDRTHFCVAPWRFIVSWTFMWGTYAVLFYIATTKDSQAWTPLACLGVAIPLVACLLPFANILVFKWRR